MHSPSNRYELLSRMDARVAEGKNDFRPGVKRHQAQPGEFTKVSRQIGQISSHIEYIYGHRPVKNTHGK